MNKLTFKEDFNLQVATYLYSLIVSSKSDLQLVGLSGGSTPLDAYKILLAREEVLEKCNFFLVDERCVEKGSFNSNFENIAQNFVENKKVSLNRLYDPNLGVQGSIIEANNKLSSHNFVFDIIVLGMGEDGHIASLFPNSLGLESIDQGYVHNVVNNAFSQRITLTYPTILSSKVIVLLTKGSNKCKIIQDAINGGNTILPISKILKEYQGELIWIKDDKVDFF